jgi:hypothetical protein
VRILRIVVDNVGGCHKHDHSNSICLVAQGIERIIVNDLNPAAVELAHQNVQFNQA